MPHVVGLQGHTGRVGAGALQYLLKAHMADEIKLIIVHRPGSDVSMIPAGVEKRELDLANASEEEIKAAVSGLQVYTSIVGIEGLGSQVALFKPLSQTPGFETYISPVLGNPMWTSETPPEDRRIAVFLQAFAGISRGPREAGIGLTVLQTGVFTDYFLDSKFKYLGTDTKANTVVLPTGGEKKPLALASAECLGNAIGELAVRPPASIKNKAFYAYDYEPTGDEIVAAFTKLHGAAPKVVEYTDADYEKAIDAGGMGASPAVYRRSWSSGVWNWRGERLGEQKRNFEQVAKEFL